MDRSLVRNVSSYTVARDLRHFYFFSWIVCVAKCIIFLFHCQQTVSFIFPISKVFYVFFFICYFNFLHYACRYSFNSWQFLNWLNSWLTDTICIIFFPCHLFHRHLNFLMCQLVHGNFRNIFRTRAQLNATINVINLYICNQPIASDKSNICNKFCDFFFF